MLAALIGLLGCAGAAEGPRTAGASAPRGWIELAIHDPSVPADPVGDPGGGAARPPPCEVELELNGVVALSERLDPQGSAPPYTVDETLRVAAPAGSHDAALYYSGCRTAWGQLDGRSAEVALVVRAGYVTRLEFDGSTVLTWPPVPR